MRAHAPARPAPRCVCARRVRAGGDTEWAELGRGGCRDDDGKEVTEVWGTVGASGEAGLAQCKAACEQRQPRCIGVSYRASDGGCWLLGSKLTRDDVDGALTSYGSYSGSDKITRTNTDYAGFVCSVFTPGKPPRPPHPPTCSAPHAPPASGWMGICSSGEPKRARCCDRAFPWAARTPRRSRG